MLSVLKQIGSPRILVVGDVMLDRYTWGDAERVSPEAPVLVLRVETREARLGGAASVAPARCGAWAEVALAGVVGLMPTVGSCGDCWPKNEIDGRLVVCDGSGPPPAKSGCMGRTANGRPHQIVRVDHEVAAGPELERSRPVCLRDCRGPHRATTGRAHLATTARGSAPGALTTGVIALAARHGHAGHGGPGADGRLGPLPLRRRVRDAQPDRGGAGQRAQDRHGRRTALAAGRTLLQTLRRLRRPW